MAFTRDWDETFPPDTQPANLLGQDIRDLKTDIRERIAAISGPIANRPAVGDMITNWGDYGANGFLYFATDTGAVYQWSGSAWVDVTATIASSRIPTVGGPIIAPTGAITLVAWRAPYACTGTFIRGYCPDGDVDINVLNNGAAMRSANLNVPSGGGFTSIAVNQNAAIAAGNSISLALTAINSGTPTYVFIQLDMTRP